MYGNPYTSVNLLLYGWDMHGSRPKSVDIIFIHMVGISIKLGLAVTSQ